MYCNLTEQQLTNVKHVLFGKQKQANVINESVVKIVARGISEVSGASVLDSESSFIAAVTSYLTRVIEGSTSGTDTLIMLLCGEQSYANLSEIGPKEVYCHQPNPESPKFIFRILMLGEEPDVDNSAEDGSYSEPAKSSSVNFTDMYEKDDDIPTRARKIKDAILTTVPDVVKQELSGNDYAQALYCAQDYFKYANVPHTSTTETLHVPGNAAEVKEIAAQWVAGKTIGELSEMFKLGTDVIKAVLRKKGFDVR